MLERFKSYFGKLQRLSDSELDRSAEKLVCAEKQNVAKLIAHIAEMSRRKVALELGYKSTFHYCVERLHLSEGSVASRIHVANVSIRFPQLLVALAENRISLTVAGLLAPHLSEDKVDTLLADCAGMTKKAVLEYLVRIEPKPVFEPSIRRRPARPVPVEPARAERPAAPPRELTLSERQLSPNSPNILQPARPTVFNFRFSADRSFKEKFERLAEVSWVWRMLKSIWRRGSGRQGHSPVGESPTVPNARFRHVAIPQLLGVIPGSLRGVNGPAAVRTNSAAAVGAIGGSSKHGSLNITECLQPRECEPC